MFLKCVGFCIVTQGSSVFCFAFRLFFFVHWGDGRAGGGGIQAGNGLASEKSEGADDASQGWKDLVTCLQATGFGKGYKGPW